MVSPDDATAAGVTVASGTVGVVVVFATDALNGLSPAVSFGARVTRLATGTSDELATVTARGVSFFGTATAATPTATTTATSARS